MTGIDGQVQASNAMLDEMVTAMASIEAASAKVSKIIKTIDEIAFQTNILALNAAVEAARAGEAGDGLRRRRRRGAQPRAARRAGRRDTSALIDESVTSAQQGSERVQRVSASIGAFTGSVTRVRELAQAVKDASREQQRGIDEVASAVQHMDEGDQPTRPPSPRRARRRARNSPRRPRPRAGTSTSSPPSSALTHAAGSAPTARRGEVRTFASPTRAPLKRVS